MIVSFERRKHKRLPIWQPVHYTYYKNDTKCSHIAFTRDISKTGILLQTDVDIPFDVPIELFIRADKKNKIKVTGKIARMFVDKNGDFKAGILFDKTPKNYNLLIQDLETAI